jgi:hypothetical protein
MVGFPELIQYVFGKMTRISEQPKVDQWHETEQLCRFVGSSENNQDQYLVFMNVL